MAPPQVTQWLSQTYPKPQIDDEWLDACCTWIADELHLDPIAQTQQFLANVENQLLESDLRDSTVEGTGLPLNAHTLHNVRIRGTPPILVEVVEITEIGHSAFSLTNVRQTRIESADLAGLAAEEGVEEDEGPVPKFPRQMLKLYVSDGTVTLPAIEYRPMPELQLGETPLGFKMLLKDALVRRGILFLEPGSVVLKGHRTEDRDAMRDTDFVRGLNRRLGRPEPDVETGENAPPAPQAPILQPVQGRVPFQEIAEPPEPNPDVMDYDDEAELPRKRRIPYVPPPPSGPPSTGATLVGSRFFATPGSSTAASRTQTSVLTQVSRVLSPVRGELIDLDSSLDDSAAIAGPSSRQAPVVPQEDFDISSDGFDDVFLEELERAEKQSIEQTSASQRTTPAPASSSAPAPSRATSVAAARPTMPPPPTQRQQSRLEKPVMQVHDVITIDDDEEDDKENVPVPKRRVRRRVSVPPDVIDLSD